MTLLGDLAQATTPWATPTWEAALRHLGAGSVRFEYLTHAFRIPRSVLDLANRLLPSIGAVVPTPVAVRDSQDALTMRLVGALEVATDVAQRAAEAARREGSTGVIVPAGLFEACAAALEREGVGWTGVEDIASGTSVTLLRAEEAKGLEFDDVVVAEPASIVDGSTRGLNTLYAALTRTVMRLTVVSSRPLPVLLGDRGPALSLS